MIAENVTATDLAGFDSCVASLRSGMKRQYDRSVNRDLSRQQSQGLFKRNVITVLRDSYQQALVELRQSALETTAGGSGLGAQVVKSFDGFIEELIVYALQKHRTSCALSNFPDEHKPGQDYIAEVIEEASSDWSAFVAQVNALLAT
jgi:hypothetical protein